MAKIKNTTPEENTKPTFEVSNITTDIFSVTECGAQPVVRDSTTTDTAILFNAVNGGGKPVKDILGESIEVVNIVITSAELPEDANDLESKKVSKPCVNFFTKDGEHFSTLSNGVVRATRNLLSCGIVPTDDNPVKLKFKSITTKKGIAHTFDLC